MKILSIAFLLAFTMVPGIMVLASGAGGDDTDSLYDKVLARYVSGEGMVDYKGLQKDKDFSKYIEYLSTTNPDTLPSDKHRLAFWINAYNAFVLKGVLEEYPLKSVRDVGWLPHSFFIRKKFKIHDGKITLRKIENEKLREGFNEPRIHFAISCASMSCPKLRKEAYRAENLEHQLEDQAGFFLSNKSKNYLDTENKVLYLSSIFKWYKEDFTKNDKSTGEYVIQFLNPDDAEFVRNNNVKIEYLDYDWGLNEQKE